MILRTGKRRRTQCSLEKYKLKRNNLPSSKVLAQSLWRQGIEDRERANAGERKDRDTERRCCWLLHWVPTGGNQGDCPRAAWMDRSPRLMVSEEASRRRQSLT